MVKNNLERSYFLSCVSLFSHCFFAINTCLFLPERRQRRIFFIFGANFLIYQWTTHFDTRQQCVHSVLQFWKTDLMAVAQDKDDSKVSLHVCLNLCKYHITCNWLYFLNIFLRIYQLNTCIANVKTLWCVSQYHFLHKVMHQKMEGFQIRYCFHMVMIVSTFHLRNNCFYHLLNN